MPLNEFKQKFKACIYVEINKCRTQQDLQSVFNDYFNLANELGEQYLDVYYDIQGDFCDYL